MEHIKNLNPVLLALMATLFTWFLTALGASLVFLNKKPSRKVFDCSLGFAGGVMVAASFFSLLLPAINLAEESSVPSWFTVAAGFVLGCIFIYILDRAIPHLHPNMPYGEKEGPRSELSLSFLLVLAITLHNIPEGLAVGVAFGSLKFPASGATFAMATSLALGIGLQNLPEGMAVSVPLQGTGISRRKAFWFGQLSGMVEPIAGVVGALAVVFFKPLLPYALAFAAGAMIYIVVEEVIPETQRAGNTDLATLSFLTGFVLMMILDVALG
ncbi:MAG TPA: ZIP family metal transporter [bacterium]|nr:ZIP family metal transporter [bacterium]